TEQTRLEAALTGRGFEPWFYPRPGDSFAQHLGPPTPNTEEGGREMLSRLTNLVNAQRSALSAIDQELGWPARGMSWLSLRLRKVGVSPGRPAPGDRTR